MHRFGTAKTVRTITFRGTANGVGPKTVSYYALTTASDTTGTLIQTQNFVSFDTYGSTTPYAIGINCTVACYGIRIVTTCIGGGNYSVVIGPVTIYCS
jgi:hypothetical protein